MENRRIVIYHLQGLVNGIDVPGFGDLFHITQTNIIKYLLDTISPIVGWCSIGTFTNPWSIFSLSVDYIFLPVNEDDGQSGLWLPGRSLWAMPPWLMVNNDFHMFFTRFLTKLLNWLVVWLPFFIFPYIGLPIIPIDELIFFSEGWPNHQVVKKCWSGNIELIHHRSQWAFLQIGFMKLKNIYRLPKDSCRERVKTY